MKHFTFVLVMVLAAIFCLTSVIGAEEDGVRILKQVSKSVVRVGTSSGMGTGFFINDQHVVTNHHCVSTYLKDNYVGGEGWSKSAEGDTVVIYFSQADNDVVKGTVVKDWPEVDLAVIKLSKPTTKRTPMQFAPSDEINAGMKVFVIGFPGVDESSVSVAYDDTASISSGDLKKIFDDKITTTRYKIQSYTATVNPGNSGGPVVDINGNVIGIANSTNRSDGQEANYGIHAPELTKRLAAANIKYTVADAAEAVPTVTATPRHTATPTMTPTFTPTPTVTPSPTPEPSPIITILTSNYLWLVFAILAAAAVVILVIRSNNQKSAKQKEAQRTPDEPRRNTPLREEPRGYSAPREEPQRYSPPREDPQGYMPRQMPEISPAPRPAPAYEAPKPQPAIAAAPVIPSASLEGISGQFTGKVIVLSRDTDCVIGKDPSVCTVLFDKSAINVSRRHCRIHYSRTHQRFVVQDLESTNGTVIIRGTSERNAPTDSSIALKDGDLICIPNKSNIFKVNL
ncbi:MAG: trypsin-like peptidase domain-containing protein [Anaerolineaceae bacterium]|nr:trypsin-like peptidase domain-containing protein [Anaerolineaceae bacterium]